MEFTLVIVLFIAGIVFIIKGGDYFVDAASWMAEVSGIPKLIIGATIVSLATTLPEMLVSVMAATQGKVDMSVGNAIGSVTANIGLIMAISIICMPAVIKRKDYLLKSALMLAGAILIVIAGFSGEMGSILSAMLFIICVIFFWENISGAQKSLRGKHGDKTGAEKQTSRSELIINIVKFVVGAIGIVWGADLLVDNGSELARFAGISERIIGVTIIAIGTSLPELITTITAIIKKQSSLSVGNIIGANIIDLTLILPVCSLLSGKPLPIAETSATLDLPACLLVGTIALIPAMVSEKFRKWQGLLLLVIYGIYVFLTCTL